MPTQSMRNNYKAREYFGIKGNRYLVLHHKDITMKSMNPERYHEWNPEDLEVMTLSEHSKLHNNGCTHPNYGKKLSDKCRKHMSENHANVSGDKNPRARKIKDIISGLEFSTIKEASEKCSISRSSIYNSLRDNKEACGYHWTYMEVLVNA